MVMAKAKLALGEGRVDGKCGKEGVGSNPGR